MLSTFIRPKPCKILLLLRDQEGSWYLSKLAKNSDSTYVYVSKLITKLQKNEYVTVESTGKKRIVKLTEKGLNIAGALYELANRMES